MIPLGSVCDPKLDLLSTYLFGLLSTHLHIGVMLFSSFHIYSFLQLSTSVTTVYLQTAEPITCFLIWHFVLSILL